MKQKKLVLTVVDSAGLEIIKKDPASFEHVQSSLLMYDSVGTTIKLQVVEVPQENQGVS